MSWEVAGHFNTDELCLYIDKARPRLPLGTHMEITKALRFFWLALLDSYQLISFLESVLKSHVPCY